MASCPVPKTAVTSAKGAAARSQTEKETLGRVLRTAFLSRARQSAVSGPFQHPVTSPVRCSQNERGSAMIEFTLTTSMLIVPILIGLIITGLSLVLANQVTEVCRDTGHMYAYGVDFSQSSSQLLVTNQLAQGLGMTPTGGRGVIYLSTITYVNSMSCTSAGLQADSTHCPNLNQTVVIKRLSIGNSSKQPSSFAPNITPRIITTSGDISSMNYLTDTSVQAPAFANLISLTEGQYAYVAEMFVNPPVVGLWALFDTRIISARSVF